MTTEEPRSNRLIRSLSPYLLQHAHNPVDWYPWEPEALEKARSENKPIFLSIGYSACHWCHVMEHECFEDEAVAEALNRHFVSIKVDREERPDIDEIYMQATLALNRGNGGWPMSLFLKPDGVPFWAGTYVPRDQFLKLAEAVAEAWQTDRQQIDEVAGQLRSYLDGWAAGAGRAAELIPAELRVTTAKTLAQAFDLDLGGIRSDRNKFPPSMAMELMLRVWQATGDRTLLEPVEVTLDRMARGGIYDHLGGGICRYSTDARWLVPHFEKMLYDQALVSSIYLDGYQVFGKKRYAEVARSIFDYVITDLQSPDGGLYSTRDADSEGLEGKYYIWTLQEVRDILGPEDARLFCAYYDVTEQGNWNEPFGHAPPGPKNILNIKQEPEKIAREFNLEPTALHSRLQSLRDKMLAARRNRVPPGLDDKILSGWNGLMIASLAKGARVLRDPGYAARAAAAADFVLSRMRRNGRLLRTCRNGQASLTGYLSDYAFMIDGLINLYEATFERRWLLEAQALAETCHKYYHDAEGGGFFFTASDGERLIARSKNPTDGAIPSGNSVHAQNLFRLALLLNRTDFRQQAESIMQALGPLVERAPYSYERLLCAVDFMHGRPKEIALAGPSAQSLAPLVDTVYSRYLPNKVLAANCNGRVEDGIALLKGKLAVGGRPTAYVCENYHCKKPVHTPRELQELLWPRSE